MHRVAPVTARLRDQPDAPFDIETAPMAIIGEKGRSQKQATLRIANRFAIRPGTALATTAFITQAPRVASATPLILALSTTSVNSLPPSLHLPRRSPSTPWLNGATAETELTPPILKLRSQ
jgi:hypothetical protein